MMVENITITLNHQNYKSIVIGVDSDGSYTGFVSITDKFGKVWDDYSIKSHDFSYRMLAEAEELGRQAYKIVENKP